MKWQGSDIDNSCTFKDLTDGELTSPHLTMDRADHLSKCGNPIITVDSKSV